ncbi:MAG TPA: WYL domain-containing protein [Acidobacteriaceae bacterium]|nr:WYL domain-containing protein [Acidobacteriaceae bacterium]
MKSDRLLSALLLLQAHGRMTGRALAERLEVSQRTMHRDMEALSAAGVPVTALRGAQGGWQLEKGWRTQVPGLDAAELRALLMAQPRALSEPRLAAAAERALGKLMASLPGAMREQAVAMRERLHVDANDWRPVSEDLSMLPAVQDAVARDCRLSFDYTRADGESGLRIVDPLGLVVKGMTWYLVARTPRGMRTYRVSRMSAVTPLAISFERPARFNLAKHWKKSVTELEAQRRRYSATLLLSPQAAESLIRWCVATPATTPLLEGTPAGWSAMRVDFESEEQALFVALGMGARVRVMEPEELRQRVAAETKAMSDAANSLAVQR